MTIREREALRRANAALRRRREMHARDMRQSRPGLRWGDYAFFASMLAISGAVFAFFVWEYLSHA